jgi:hypothetical protein
MEERFLIKRGSLMRQVLIGASTALIPESETAENPQGLFVKLEWRQDESGRLCLARQSDLLPVAPGQRIDVVATIVNKRRSRLLPCCN